MSRRWIEQLAHSANTSGGIQLVPERVDVPPIHMPEQDADPHAAVAAAPLHGRGQGPSPSSAELTPHEPEPTV